MKNTPWHYNSKRQVFDCNGKYVTTINLEHLIDLTKAANCYNLMIDALLAARKELNALKVNNQTTLLIGQALVKAGAFK